MEAAQRAWKTLCLDDIDEGDITLSIDTSGSMYVYLDFVRREVTKWLRRQCQHRPARRFNMVHYASVATRWQPKSVNCSYDNVTAAENWLMKQQCSTNSNLLDGLACAFADLFVEAVYVLSDGSTDYPSSLILESVLRSCRGRPVHVFIFQHEGESCQLSHSSAVYEQLALRTGGFLQLVHVPRPSLTTPWGVINFPLQQPLVRVDTYVKSARQREEQGCCSVIPARPILQQTGAIPLAKTAWELIRGLRVLARRSRDGVYYTGQIHDQLDNTTVHVRFDHSFHGSFDSFQATPISDVVSLVDARRQPVSVGDYTLTLYGHKGAYYPGQVTDETYSKQEGKSLTVTLFDGTKVFHVIGDWAVKISQEKYERLSKELRLKEGDLLKMTATESVEEERKLLEDLKIQQRRLHTHTSPSISRSTSRSSSRSVGVIVKSAQTGNNQDLEDGTPTVSGSSSLGQTGSESSLHGQSINGKRSSEDDTPVTYKPGTILSLGLSYSDGYRAGYHDGNMHMAGHSRTASPTSSSKPRWRWWSRSPGELSAAAPFHSKPEASPDHPDIDSVIRSRRHRCTDAKINPDLARPQSLTAVYHGNRPSTATARDVIYQRPHTADPASLRETERIEYRRGKQQSMQERMNDIRVQRQVKDASVEETKRSRKVQQRMKEAERVAYTDQSEERRLAHKQKSQRQQSYKEVMWDRDESKQRETREKTSRDRRQTQLEWEKSLENTAHKLEEQRMAAVKQRAEDRYRETAHRWEETKLSQDHRRKQLQDRRAKQEKKISQRIETERRDLEIERYAVTNDKLLHRATLVP